MNDFAGVEPHRVRQLADRLQDLATALAKNGAVIRNNFGTWGPALIDLGQLAAQASQVAHDARDMGKRADQAINLLHSGALPALCHAGGDFYGVPWDVTAIDSTKEAQQEAAELKEATANPDDPASREIIDSVGQSLADHQDDPAYMNAFLKAGGIDTIVKVPTALHQQDGTHDGTVLSKASEQTLARYGQAVDTLSNLAMTNHSQQAGPDYLAPLTDLESSDPWAVGMLFKYGPPGDKWNPQVLSDVTGSMLDWRAQQSTMRYGFLGTGQKKGINEIPSDAWYSELGLGPDGDIHTDDTFRQALRDNDPALAVLNRTGENAQASRDLLGQDTPDARRHAEQLVDYTWQTPGFTTWDDSGPVSRVLIMAATDRSDARMDQSGQAAANILQAAARQNDVFTHRDSLKKDAYPAYPQQTAIALAGITGTWADQIGGTSRNTPGTRPEGYSTGEHVLVLYHDTVQGDMELFARDNPSAAAMFDTTMHQQVADAAAAPGPDDQLTNLGDLVGLFTKAKNNVSYTKAQELDEKHKTNQAILDTVGLVFEGGSVPKALKGKTKDVVTRGLKYSQTLVKWSRGVEAKQTDPFSTDNAAKQDWKNAQAAKDVPSTFNPAMAQGLIRAGKIPPPPPDKHYGWYNPDTMTVAPGAEDDRDFQAWWYKQSGATQGGAKTGDAPAYAEWVALLTGYENSEGADDGH